MSMTSQTSFWNQMVQEFVQNDPTSSNLANFFRQGVDRVGIVKDALRMSGGNSRVAIIALLKKMNVDEQKLLFPELIQLARAAHGPVGVVREIILCMPRQWVLTHLASNVENILKDEEYDDYWMFLELYQQLEPGLAVELARRAANHANADIRELGLRHLVSLIKIAANDGTIRSRLGPIWQESNSQTNDRLDLLAEDLTAIAEGVNHQVDMTHEQEGQYRAQAVSAYIAMKTGDVDSALVFLRRPFPRSIPRGLIPFLQSRCWEKLGDLEIALIFMREAERHDPTQAASVLTLLLLLPRTKEMMHYADRIISNVAANSPEVVYLASTGLLAATRNMNNAEARQTLERIITPLQHALKIWTTLPDPPYLDRNIIEVLGVCYERLGDEKEARHMYDDGLLRYPDDAELLTFRGINQYRENTTAALQDFAKAADKDTHLVWPYYFLAWHALKRSAYRQALTLAEKAARRAVIAPVRAQIHEIIAIALSMLGGSLHSVMQNFDQAIAIDPSNERIRRNREIAEQRVTASSLDAQPWVEPMEPSVNTTRESLESEIEGTRERIDEFRSGRTTKAVSMV